MWWAREWSFQTQGQRLHSVFVGRLSRNIQCPQGLCFWEVSWTPPEPRCLLSIPPPHLPTVSKCWGQEVRIWWRRVEPPLSYSHLPMEMCRGKHNTRGCQRHLWPRISRDGNYVVYTGQPSPWFLGAEASGGRGVLRGVQSLPSQTQDPRWMREGGGWGHRASSHPKVLFGA